MCAKWLTCEQLYVAEVKKTGLIEVDEGNIVNELMKRDADTIGFEELKEWTQSPSESLKEAQKQDVQTDPFGTVCQQLHFDMFVYCIMQMSQYDTWCNQSLCLCL